MRSPATTTILGPLALSTLALASISLAGGVGPEPENDRAVLAWIRFVDGEETYAGVPYLWLGKVNIELQIDVKPDPGHVIEILWGSKSDTREAVATVNGNDVRLGAVQHDDGLYVSMIADEPWSGKLLFDKPRHQLQMRLPIDYPRINQFPEWFTAKADRPYTVANLNAGSETSFSGGQLQEGMPVQIEPGKELRLIVTRAD